MDANFHKKRLEEYLLRFANSQGDITLEEAVCEIETIMSDRIADVENALCELDGGNNE